MKQPEPPPAEVLLQHQRAAEEMKRLREEYNRFEERRRKEHRDFRVAHQGEEGYLEP